MRTVIDSCLAGLTVKQYLFSVLKLSRAQVTLLKKKENGIIVNGERVFVTYSLKCKDILELALDDSEEDICENLVPLEIPLDILYEDEELIAVNKPPYMPTHPSFNHRNDTLANALAFYYRDKPFVFRAVNRLDRDTSGVVLIAKNKRTSAALSLMMKERLFTKKYLALLRGEVPEDAGTIDKNIVRAENSIMLRRTDETSGEPALTEYTVLQRKNGYTLVSAIPHTGRTHQLRVHFSSVGYPIVGDMMYGKDADTIGRQALHAAYLAFEHPICGKRIQISAPLPQDFKELLKEKGFETVLG